MSSTAPMLGANPHLASAAYNSLNRDNPNMALLKNNWMYSFKWLDKIMLYLLCVSTFNDGGNIIKRSKRLMIISLNVISFVICIVLIGYILFSQVKFIKNQKAYIVSILGSVALICSRIFSFYYYYHDFNYPWYHSIIDAPQVDNTKEKWYSRTLIFLLVIQVTVIIFDICIPNEGLFTLHQNEHVAVWLFVYFVICFVWLFPNFFTLAIHSVICFKYYMYLQKLKSNLKEISKNNRYTLDDICNDYKKILQSFENEYTQILQISIQVDIAAWLLILWIDIAITKELGFWPSAQAKEIDIGSIFIYMTCDISRVVVKGCMYFISGCILSEQFKSFKDELWTQLENSIGSVDDQNNDLLRQKLLLYVRKKPINIQIGSLTLTITNTVQILIGLIISAGAAHLLKSL